MPEDLLAMVQPDRIGAQQPPHPLDQVRIRGLDYQVETVAPQTIGMNLAPRLLAGSGLLMPWN